MAFAAALEASGWQAGGEVQPAPIARPTARPAPTGGQGGPSAPPAPTAAPVEAHRLIRLLRFLFTKRGSK